MRRAFALSFLLFLPLLTAQERLGSGAAVGIGDVVGLQAMPNGEWLGLGNDYQVRFGADRFEFLPYLGKRAPHDLPIGVVATHVGRGELAPVGPATRETHELRVDYARPQFTERLDIRSAGLEQSFVFAQLPPGDGDLVVRVQVTTELLAAPASDGSLQFTLPDTGGVAIGTVVGIDARGRRVPGWLHAEGDHVDYVLPRAFVADAALPLVLDPTITPILTVDTAAQDDRSSQVAFTSASIQQCMVVWRRAISAADHNIFARRFTSTGLVQGLALALEATAADAGEPRVAGCSTGWVAAWEQAGDVHGAFVPTALAAAIVPLAIATSGQSEVSPDIAGGAGSSVTIVWRNATTNSIDARVYNGTLLATGTLVSGTSATTVSNPTVTRCSPTIRALLTYSANGLGTTSVRAQLFNRTSATAIAAAFSIASTSLLGSVGNAVNCGDGVSFVVAWEGDSVLGRRVNCVSVRHNGVVEELGASRSIAGVGIDARSPDLAWLDNSVVVGWASQTGSTYDIRITSIDPFTCLDCEGEFLIGSGANNTVSVTSCITGATVRDFGGVTFTLGNPANPLLRLFATIDGTQTHLGGGCNLGARVYATSARTGNANFGFWMTDAPAAQFSLLALSTAAVPGGLPCGTCTVHPDTTSGVVVSTGLTSVAGTARYALPIPPSAVFVGVDLFGQFAMLGSNCISLLDLSSALGVTIE